MASDPQTQITFTGSPSGAIVEKRGPLPQPAEDEVLIKITHSGLCFTDIHYRETDTVLGHEGVGIIQAAGSKVINVKLNDRVGFGYLHNTCNHCSACLAGHETQCADREWYGEADRGNGSFASHAVWKSTYVFQIPDKLSSEAAAPLQCAGATVFNVLYEGNVRPTERVGIIGVGGLGHLAIQFANKMGCEVVVFSSSSGKEQEARELGASEFVVVGKPDDLASVKSVSRLIVTTNHIPDWKTYAPLLANEATVHPLTITEDDFSFPGLPLTVNGLKIQGSAVASRGVHVKMMDFAARHGIKPIVEQFELGKKGIETAMEKLVKGGMRYRAVLVAPEAFE